MSLLNVHDVYSLKRGGATASSSQYESFLTSHVKGWDHATTAHICIQEATAQAPIKRLCQAASAFPRAAT